MFGRIFASTALASSVVVPLKGRPLTDYTVLIPFLFFTTSSHRRASYHLCLLAGQLLRPHSDRSLKRQQKQSHLDSTPSLLICTSLHSISFYSSHTFSNRMNKGPTTSAVKTSAPLPRQSAWAKGPPQATSISSSASSPRPQSPAPAASQSHSQSHSRRSSQLGNSKDAVAVGIAVAGGTRGNVPPTKTSTSCLFSPFFP